jgi:hypothetical protein
LAYIVSAADRAPIAAARAAELAAQRAKMVRM